MPAFSRKKVKRLAQEVVAEHPDGFNRATVYFDNGEPCCFVGHIFAKCGITFAMLPPYTNSQGVCTEAMQDFLLEQGFSHKAIDWLEEVQQAADRTSYLWRNILEAANSE